MHRNLLLGLALLLAVSVPAFAGDPTGTIYVAHGINGSDLGLDTDLPVDITVDGACFLTDFRFGDFAGPVELATGTYDIEVRLSDGACGGGVAISVPGLPVNMGENSTILAYLTDAGTPTAGKFVNDLSNPGPGLGRLGAFHTANAPAVDVYAKERDSMDPPILALEGVTNGVNAALDLPAGRWSLALRAAGTNVTVLGPAGVRVQSNALVNVFVVGSLDNDTLSVLVQRLRLD